MLLLADYFFIEVIYEDPRSASGVTSFKTKANDCGEDGAMFFVTRHDDAVRKERLPDGQTAVVGTFQVPISRVINVNCRRGAKKVSE